MKSLVHCALVMFACMITIVTSGQTGIVSVTDSIRIRELNLFWTEVSRTVRDGDFEGYKATYHPDAVCVFTTGKKKFSSSITAQLDTWKPGFTNTKTGKTKDKVEFRFSHRVGDATTAHETGIFYFTSADKDGKLLSQGAVHFESLLVKRNGMWMAMMEYQKTKATEEEWNALK
jgi:hypothetical protein